MPSPLPPPAPRRSLATRLIGVFILIVTLSLAILGAGLILIANRAQETNVSRLQQQYAQQAAGLISGYIRRAADRLRVFAEIEALSTLGPEDQKIALERLVIASLPLYSQISMLDRRGKEQSKVSRFHTFLPDELNSQAQAPAFAAVMAGNHYIGDPAFLADTGLLSVTLALPLRSGTADIAGVILAAVDVGPLWDQTAQIRIGQSGYAYVVDRQGRFVAHQNAGKLLQQYGMDMRRMPPVAEFLAGGREGAGTVSGYRGLFEEDVVGVYAPIEGTRWAVVVEQTAAEAYRSIAKMRIYFVGLLLICIVFAASLAFLLARHLIVPIRSLTAAAQRLGAGDLETTFADVKRQDEVGVLSQAFNTMQRELRDLYAGLRRNVAELESVQVALRQSEEQYRLLIENQSDLIVKVDLDGRILFASRTYCEAFGKSEAQLLGQQFMPLVHQADRPATAREMENLFAPSHTVYIEQQALTKNGWRWMGWQNSAVLDEDRKVVAIIGVGRDITKRVQAQAALKESEERFRALVEKAPLGIVLIGSDGRCKYLNPNAVEVLGYTIEDAPTVEAWLARAFPHETHRQRVRETWREDRLNAAVGPKRTHTFTVTGKDGMEKTVLFRTVTLENQDQFMIFEDITEKSKMEQQLRQAQKLEAVGTLAGGIAHDFNNLMMGVQGRASLMRTDLQAAHPQVEHLEAIETYVRSATDLTKQLLGLARGGKYEVKPIDVNELALDSAAMFGRTRKEIQIHTKATPDPLVVEADRRQIEQVLLNMYINAWQAMFPGGRLYLETAAVDLDVAETGRHQAASGPYARIAVTDTGVGMDEATRQRVFDPFFTTKEKARGTGLGLASAYGIIKNHGGMITVDTEVDRGTTFNVYLPLSGKTVEREAPVADVLIKGSGTVLLVDDEEMIIEVGQAMLEKLGYRVLAAQGGDAAIAAAGDAANRIDLVILDLIMPGMDGGQTFDRIRAIRPGLPVILSSGYAVNGMAEKVMRRGCNGFIQKPFSIAELSRQIRKILDDESIER